MSSSRDAAFTRGNLGRLATLARRKPPKAGLNHVFSRRECGGGVLNIKCEIEPRPTPFLAPSPPRETVYMLACNSESFREVIP